MDVPTVEVSPTLSKAVIEYQKAGAALFPCKADKTPLHFGWRQVVANPNLPPAYFSPVYGVNLTDEDLVLDVDPRRFKDGENQLKDFCDKIGLTTLDTFIVETGGGGVHAYFKKPSWWEVRSKVPGFPAIEIKTEGQFVIGAGSRHPNGSEYRIIRKHPGDIATAPNALLDFVRAEDAVKTAPGVVSDDEGTKSRYIQFLMRANPAVAGEGGNNQTYEVACKGYDFGLSQQVCFDLIKEYYNERCSPKWTLTELEAIVEHAYTYSKSSHGCLSPQAAFNQLPLEIIKPKEVAEPTGGLQERTLRWDFVPSKLGMEYKSTVNNAVNFFLITTHDGKPNPLAGLVRFNKMAQNIEFAKVPPWERKYRRFWEDADDVELRHYFSTTCNFHIGTELARDAVLIASRMWAYDPLIDWLDSLQWDGVPRLAEVLHKYTGCIDNAYTRAVSEVLFIGAVSRGYDPGCKFDTMVVLEGAQGKGKSTFVEAVGGEFYFDIGSHLDPSNKDTPNIMLGYWVIEASELAFYRKHEAESIKSFLTIKKDVVRLPYNARAQAMPRRGIFIGTTNQGEFGNEYLTDTTGNRRFLPIRTGEINIPGFLEVRSQIFAEAKTKYFQGAPNYLATPDAVALAEAEQMLRLESDAWVEIITPFLEIRKRENISPTVEEVLTICLNIRPERIGPKERRRAANAMKMLGWKNKILPGGGRVWEPSS